MVNRTFQSFSKNYPYSKISMLKRLKGSVVRRRITLEILKKGKARLHTATKKSYAFTIA